MATTKALELAQLSSNLVVDANGNITNINVDSDQVSEGNNNIYYTTARANTDIDARVTKSYVDALGINADTLDTLDSASFMRSDANTSTTGNLSVGGDLSVTGDFTVSGNTTYVNTNDLSIEDLNITLASGANTAADANNAGITIAGANAQITYNSTNDTFDFNKAITGDGSQLSVNLTDLDDVVDFSAYMAGAGATHPFALVWDTENNQWNVGGNTIEWNAAATFVRDGGTANGNVTVAGTLTAGNTVVDNLGSYGPISSNSTITAIGGFNGSISNTTLNYSTTTLTDGVGSQGNFYFDALNQKLKVHTGSVWVDAVPAGGGSTANTGSTDAVATFRKYTYEISTSTNSVQGTDANGETLSYVTDGSQNVEVFVNGVKNVETNDYVASTGSAVTFTYNLSADDVVDIQVYELLTQDAFYLKTDTYTQTEINSQISTALSSYVPAGGGTFSGDVTFSNGRINIIDANNAIRSDQSAALYMAFDLAGSEKFRLKRVGDNDVQLVPKQYSTGTTAASYPAYTFSEDDNSGLGWFGADAIQLITGGTTRVIVDSLGRMTVGKTSTIGTQDTFEIHGGNIVNPNSTGAEITSATLGFGSNIHLEERQPAGAYSDRTDLAFVLDTGYGLGESEKFRMTAGGRFGIGESNPVNPLHIAVDTASSMAFSTSGNGGGIFLESNSASAGGTYGTAINFTRLLAGSNRRKAAIVSKQFSGDGEDVGLTFFTAKGDFGSNSNVGEVLALRGDGDANFTGNVNVEKAIKTDEVRHDIRPSLTLDFARAKTLDSRISYSRDSIGTYYDSKGVLRYAKHNEPRFDHDPVTGESLGLLVERNRTNILTHSNNLAHSLVSGGSTHWQPRGLTLEPNQAAPDGTMTAVKVTENGTSTNPGFVSLSDLSNGSNQTFSVWLKSDAPTTVLLSCTGSATGEYVSLTTEWQRFETTDNYNAGSGPHIGGFNTVTQGGGQSWYVWGPQLEYGDYATSYVPSDSRFYSRLSKATYHDENGVLRTAPMNSPRYGYAYDGRKWVSAGLIAEEAATNTVRYSEYVGGWNIFAVNQESITAPDGSTGLFKFIPTTTNTQHYVAPSFTTSAGSTYCMSFYVKDYGLGEISFHLTTALFTSGSATFNFTTKTFTIINDIIDAGYQELADGWFRIWCVATADATGSSAYYIGMPDLGSYASNGTDGVGVWGCQAEVGYAPTSYIRTLDGSVTRSADVVVSYPYTRRADKAVIYNPQNDWYNEDAGTVYIEADSSIPASDTGGGRLGFSYDNSNDDRWMMNINSSSYSSYIQADGQTTVNMNNVAPGQNVMHKRANAATANDFASYINGSKIGEDVSVVMPKINSFRLYNPTTEDDFLDGHFRKIAYYPERLSNAQLEALTEND